MVKHQMRGHIQSGKAALTDGAGESEAASDEVRVNKAFPPLDSATLMAFETF